MVENKLLEKALDRRYLEPYAGKWVAIVDETVVAWAESAVEVLAQAKKDRPKADPEIMKVPRKDEGPLVV